MSPITSRDFQSSSPVEPSALQGLQEALVEGWVEISKIHHQSANFRIKVAAARESIAKNLGVDSDELDFVGELGFGFWSAIAGLLAGSNGQEQLIHSVIDRQVVHAFSRQAAVSGRKTQIAKVDRNGRFDVAALANNSQPSLVFWQGTNRETGTEQVPPALPQSAKLFADMTARFDPKQLPRDWSVALWDPRSFGGPEGLAILAIKRNSSWRSPIPPMDGRRLYGSYSKPLLISAAIALEIWSRNLEANRAELSKLNNYARSKIAKEIPEISLVGDSDTCDPRNLALALPVISEELLRFLERREILVDAGSACGAGALSPSHVLDALGYEGKGHIRVTFKLTHKFEDIDALLAGISEYLRSTN